MQQDTHRMSPAPGRCARLRLRFADAIARELTYSASPDLTEIAERPPSASFKFLTEDEMDRLPDPEWLLPNVLQEQSTMLFVGAWATYKSFIALDLSMAIASGEPTAFGVKPARVGPVIYCALEGFTGIGKKRRQAWRMAHPNAPVRVPFFLGPAPRLSKDGEQKQFDEGIRTILKEHCNGDAPAMIVIDTLSKSMAGLDETRDAATFIDFTERLSRAYKCVVLVLHHFGHDKEKGARGGTIYPAGFDGYMEGEAAGDKRLQITVKKQKDAETPPPFFLQGRKLGNSLVFQHVDRAEHGAALAAVDPLSWQGIEAALTGLNALSADKGVNTRVMTLSLLPMRIGEDGAVYEERVKVAVAQLKRLARNKLAEFCTQITTGPLWHLPARAEPPDYE